MESKELSKCCDNCERFDGHNRKSSGDASVCGDYSCSCHVNVPTKEGRCEHGWKLPCICHGEVEQDTATNPQEISNKLADTRDWEKPCEEEFDKEFPNWGKEDGSFKDCYLSGGHCDTDANKIKHFVKSIRQKAQQEAIDKSIEIIRNHEIYGKGKKLLCEQNALLLILEGEIKNQSNQ